MSGIPIGQLLVQQGVLTEQQVKHILRVQKACHRPFGDLAERLYNVSPKAVEDAWVKQYKQIVGTVDLNDLEVDEDCLRKLNRRQAWQFNMLPIASDNGTLSVATTADNLVRGVNFATHTFEEPAVMLLAERKQLREFLMKHYPVPGFMAAYAATLG